MQKTKDQQIYITSYVLVVMPGRMKLKSKFSAVVSCWDIKI